MLGKVIRAYREQKGLTQEEYCKYYRVSRKTLSAIENGDRDIGVNRLQAVIKELNDPRLYLEAINELTGGVFAVNWLDGDSIDLHRSSVKEKVIEELQEALEAINLTKIYKYPSRCTDDEIKIIIESLNEVVDVFNAAGIYIAVLCDNYGLDVREVFNHQREKLINRKYLRR